MGLLSSTCQSHTYTHTVCIELHGSRLAEGRGGEGRGGEEWDTRCALSFTTAGWQRGGEGRAGEGRGGQDGKLHWRYPEEGTGQYTVYSQTIPQRGPCP